MCYNCGCGMPNDDMGMGHALKEPDGKSITNETFKTASDDPETLKKEIFNSLTNAKPLNGKINEEMFKLAADSQGMTVDEAKEETVKLLKREIKA